MTMLIWVLVIVLIILTIILLSGRGGWLIAGYNTSSKEEKEKYNEKKLCRWTGLFVMIPTDIFFALCMIQESDQVILLETGVFSIYIIGIVVFANRKGIGKVKE